MDDGKDVGCDSVFKRKTPGSACGLKLRGKFKDSPAAGRKQNICGLFNQTRDTFAWRIKYSKLTGNVSELLWREICVAVQSVLADGH